MLVVVALAVAQQVDAGAGLGREQPHQVVAAQERLVVEVLGRARPAAQRQLVALLAVGLERPPPAVGPDGEGGLRLGADALAGVAVDVPDVERGAGRALVGGKFEARPEIRTLSGFSGTTSVVRGARSLRKAYIWAKVSAEVATWTWLWSGSGG